jgi:hypothetical protein
MHVLNSLNTFKVFIPQYPSICQYVPYLSLAHGRHLSTFQIFVVVLAGTFVCFFVLIIRTVFDDNVMLQ